MFKDKMWKYDTAVRWWTKVQKQGAAQAQWDKQASSVL